MTAEVGGEAVGRVLPTRASIHDGRSGRTALALAPLSAVPELQRRQIGERLVESAHIRAAALGHSIVLVVGIPGYDRRSGYERLSRAPIALPFVAPGGNCSVLALRAGALDGVARVVRYAEGCLDH